MVEPEPMEELEDIEEPVIEPLEPPDPVEVDFTPDTTLPPSEVAAPPADVSVQPAEFDSVARTIAATYRRALSQVGDLRLLEDQPDTVPVYHQMTVLSSKRNELKSFLAERGIGTAIHYPMALHLQPAFSVGGGPPAALPVAEAAGEQVLCLPMFPQLTDAEVETVCAGVVDYFD